MDASQWTAVTTASFGYTSGKTACFVNTPNNIFVRNGYLNLVARKETREFSCTDPQGSFYTRYTSGYVSTTGLFSQAYGLFEVRAKVSATAVQGLQSSFWLYPQDETKYGPWPASGEIDIAETYSKYPTLAIPFIHYNYDSRTTDQSTDTNVVTNDSCPMKRNQFNDYMVEWTPTTIKMMFNGTTCLIDHWIPSSPLVAPEPFDQPFFINLTQALGINTNAFEPSTTPLPATTQVDYVRAWTNG